MRAVVLGLATFVVAACGSKPTVFGDDDSGTENFFGVNFGTGRLLGAPYKDLLPMAGDILLTQEVVTQGTTGLFRLQWDGSKLVADPIQAAQGSAMIGQWEHVTTAGAGINEIPPPPGPK